MKIIQKGSWVSSVERMCWQRRITVPPRIYLREETKKREGCQKDLDWRNQTSTGNYG